MQIEYIKCHGSGNDFVLIDMVVNPVEMEESYWPKFSEVLCDRSLTEGADGVLFFVKDENGTLRMRMFNPDGTESQMCGNGMRCCARYVDENISTKIDVIASGLFNYRVNKELSLFEDMSTFSVNIPATTDVKELPLNVDGTKLVGEIIGELDSTLRFTAISVGNPHIVASVDTIDIDKLVELGESIDSLKHIFPEGVNVSLYRVVEKNSIYVSTYERGAGLTSSCGTAMTSSSVAAVLLGLCDAESSISVYNSGGMVKTEVSVDGDGAICRLIGNATFESKVVIDYSLDRGAVLEEIKRSDNCVEISQYSRYVELCSEVDLK